MNVIELHKKDLAAGTAKLHSLTPQSNEWWEIKERLKKYEIAWAQSFNTAVQLRIGDTSGARSIADMQLEHYQHLTAPYRPEKKLPKGMANIDDEVGENGETMTYDQHQETIKNE